VETNPLFDSNNETAKMAVEWIGSLFGKSIMGVR
jgi:arginase family enzyme